MGTVASSTTLVVNNTITASSDGYLRLVGGAAAGTAVAVDLLDKNGTYITTTFLVTAVSSYGSATVSYIKKGTKLKATRIDSGTGAFFFTLSH